MFQDAVFACLRAHLFRPHLPLYFLNLLFHSLVDLHLFRPPPLHGVSRGTDRIRTFSPRQIPLRYIIMNNLETYPSMILSRAAHPFDLSCV